ncbi:MAG TPA: iron-containing alcohol dehydrogenase [Pseudomonadales bacterium]
MQRTFTARAQRETRQVVLLDDAELASALHPLRDWAGGRRTLVVTTPTVYRLYGSAVSDVLAEHDVSILVLDCNESTKGVAQVERVCRSAHAMRLSRTDLLIGLGGGVCTDITTVAASWLRRGIEHVRVPTTLLGQVDAGIGYKGAVNFDGHKSYIGCFHAPSHVLIVPRFLYSLPAHAIREGFAEIIKIAMVRDAELFGLIEGHAVELVRTSFRSRPRHGLEVIWRAVQRMLEELGKNPYEDRTYERLVDFGHTFSPLLEAASRYRLSHGRAVAVDMALTTVISSKLGLVDTAFRERVLDTIASLELPVYSNHLTVELCEESLRGALLHRGGKPNLVLPNGLGTAQFLGSADDIGKGTFAAAIRVLEARHRQAPFETRQRQVPTTPSLTRWTSSEF